MHISTITFSNFRCFGSSPTTINLKRVNVLIGENGAGKSAVLVGFARLFGIATDDRTVRVDDFHIDRGKTRSDFDEDGIKLWIEARIEFPELQDDTDEESFQTIPQNFRQMLVDDTGSVPHCRIRLIAEWQKGNLPDGEIEQTLYWVTKATNDEEEFSENDCFPMKPVDRQQIHVHYVPASRDPSKHLRVATRSMLKRLLDSAIWSDDLADQVENATEELGKSIAEEKSIQELQSQINNAWKSLYNRKRFTGLSLELESQRLEDVVSTLSARLLTEDSSQSDGVQRLSDGLRSLLYFTLVKSSFVIEQDAVTSDQEEATFDRDKLNPPLLTLFAIEEPETHLAPHLLGRILKMIRDLVESYRAQAVFSSHSPSVMNRIEPEEVRHLALDPSTDCTIISELPIPTGDQVAEKFIRQAVQAFPELYFARAVVLGEGDSEVIILNRLFEANDYPTDPNVISIVPLGGRHVNHMWKLLSSLSISFVTILDLDRERSGGGWGRIHYVCEQLIENGVDRDQLLLVGDGDDAHVLSDEEFEEMKKWKISSPELMNWVESLEQYGVFFSSPLDIDFLLYRAFRDVYKQTTTSGPRQLSEKEDVAAKQKQALKKAVLRDVLTAGQTYSDAEIASFSWYRHLFLTRSKPATHMSALSMIEDDAFLENCPEVLTRLLTCLTERAKQGQGDS
ncbi:AAA family ATPase [Thalassoglobus polymorphus]|uniref:Uncharacterized protein n=1 Tax=Thalassoglobus polymorphus TaxID=2527994 RepID=A0A517QJY4_9PLAN|nr:AAA family ATPase [Thalassoglobus polymorphus]QDT31951.1 hypothetical protein Mal48_11900 [Thalassoglobus polymorphus]